jgi:thiol:disulfide interchange protein DsbD
MNRCTLALLLLAASAAPALAQFGGLSLGGQLAGPPRAAVQTAVNLSSIPAAHQAVVAIVLDVPDGCHIPAAVPGVDSLLPFVLTVDPNPHVAFLPTVYPTGQKIDFVGLGRANAYLGRLTIFLPFTINADTPPGPITISGKFDYQICTATTCFPPADQPFSATAQIVPASDPPVSANAELFTDFDPRVFAAAQAAPAAAKSVAVDFFGHGFQLGVGAWQAALPLALLVGLIFNLMPCVLPVLPLKAIGFYESAGHDRARSLLLGLVFAGGMLCAFAVLAVLVVVKHLVWGQQFSNPYFLWPMVAVLIVMAIAMFGALDLALPSSVYQFTPRHDTIGGNFLFGAFAALLATPCTAPMLVGILAWATNQPQWLGFTAILTVGLGMSLPYLVLSAVPELARKLPRGGAAPQTIKQTMGFLILAVAAFFAGGRLLDPDIMWWLVFSLIAAAALFLIVRTLLLTTRPIPIVASLTAAAILVVPSFLFVHNITKPTVAWIPFTDAALTAARATGRPVLIDFTAFWCSTCQVIDNTVFHDPATIDLLRTQKFITLKADVSAKDAPGWPMVQSLTQAGGIPLTVLYFPGHQSPVLLTSLYRPQNLADAVRQQSR